MNEQPRNEEVWEDLDTLFARSRTSDVEFVGRGTAQAVISVLAVNRNAGNIADRIIRMGAGMGTEHDVARAITDTITSGFVALSYFCPDPREYWEISLRELIVITENR